VVELFHQVEQVLNELTKGRFYPCRASLLMDRDSQLLDVDLGSEGNGANSVTRVHSLRRPMLFPV